jgi:hypothetical protein
LAFSAYDLASVNSRSRIAISEGAIRTSKLLISGPTAWCSRPEVTKNILLGLNATTAVRDSGEKIYDFKNATTTKIDLASKTAACHGVAQASNGQALPGTFSIEVNGAGNFVWRWMNDDLPPQKKLPGQFPS